MGRGRPPYSSCSLGSKQLAGSCADGPWKAFASTPVKSSLTSVLWMGMDGKQTLSIRTSSALREVALQTFDPLTFCNPNVIKQPIASGRLCPLLLPRHRMGSQGGSSFSGPSFFPFGFSCFPSPFFSPGLTPFSLLTPSVCPFSTLHRGYSNDGPTLFSLLGLGAPHVFFCYTLADIRESLVFKGWPGMEMLLPKAKGPEHASVCTWLWSYGFSGTEADSAKNDQQVAKGIV